MSIYSSAHSGVVLDPNTLTNLGLQETDLRGYFSKTKLEELLSNHQNCAGIRFYNVNPSTEFPSLLAVTVLDNGFDMNANGTHMHCFAINDASDKVLVLSRSGAHAEIKKAYTFDIPESEKFSSFFSKTMLGTLLSGSNKSGVAFYKVITLGGRSTHLAVTSNLGKPTPNSNIPIHGINGTGFKNCLSDQPCPGHCVGTNPTIPSPTPAVAGIDGPYIPIWDEEKDEV